MYDPYRHQQHQQQQYSQYQQISSPNFGGGGGQQQFQFQQQRQPDPNFYFQQQSGIANYQPQQPNYQQQFQPNYNYQSPPPPQQFSQQNFQQHDDPNPIPPPPEWMLTKCGARFSFAGKLLLWTTNGESTTTIHFCQSPPILDDDDGSSTSVSENSSQLYAALVGGCGGDEISSSSSASSLSAGVNLPFVADLCRKRGERAEQDVEKCIWQFLEAHVRRQPRERYVEIVAGRTAVNPTSSDASVNDLSERIRSINNSAADESAEIILNGSCYSGGVMSKSMSVAASDSSSQGDEDDGAAAGDAFWKVTEPATLTTTDQPLFELPNDPNSKEGLLFDLITNGKYAEAVDVCVVDGRWADALQLAMQERNLFVKTQFRYYEQSKDPISKLICLVVNDRWKYLIANCSLFQNPKSSTGGDSWRRLFILLINHVESNELADRLEELGSKMECTLNKDYSIYASLCYIAAGSVDRLLEILAKRKSDRKITFNDLHNIMEVALVLRVSLGGGNLRGPKCGPILIDRLGEYAYALIENGCSTPLALQVLDLLPEQTSKHLMELRHRLYNYQSLIGYLPRNVRCPKPAYSEMAAGEMGGRLRQMQHQTAAMRSRAASLVGPPPISQQSQYGYAQQQYHYQQQEAPPPPPISAAQQSGGGVTAMKSARSRYPSYSSDGISYPTASSAGGGMQYMGGQGGQLHQQYGGHQQQQWAGQQQSSYSPAGDQQFGYQQQTGFNNPPMAGQHQQNAPSPHFAQHASMGPAPAGPAAQLHHRAWNDPPTLSPKKKSSNSSELCPVTFPVLGGGGGGVVPDQNAYPQQQQGQMMTAGGYYQQIQNQNQQIQQNQQVSASSAQHSPAPVVPPVVIIPAEHERLLSVLTRLAELTASRATNMQMKMRIEENLHKLKDNLPPALVYGKLSPTTLQELHQLIDYVQSFDYHSSLALHSAIVQGSDFTTISTFMPCVKSIIQFALQLGVYYTHQ